jgi:hypothetical protein
MRAHQPRALFLFTALLSLFLVSCFGGHHGGGGGGGGTPTPKLRVDFTGPSAFSPNQIGASYTLTVRNKGDAATSGTVTLADPPTGMTVTSIAGANWTCTVVTTTCTRSDSLAPGASYDPITVTGNVTAPAGGSVSATVTVTGGGAATFSGSGSIPVSNGATGGAVSLIQPGVLFPQLVAGSKLSLQATVGQGDNGSGVNWGVQAGDTCSASGFTSSLGTQGGSVSLGTVPPNAANGAVVTYTAPSPAPAAPNNAFTITALQAPSTTGPCIVVTIVATNNSLFSGNYVFRFRGFVSTGQTFAIISQLHADGVGSANLSSGITAGLEDVNIGQTGGSSAAFPKVGFTGGYNMDSPSHGTMELTITSPPWASLSLSNPPPTTMTFSFTLSLDGSFGGLIETDGAATPLGYVGSGDFQFQGPSKNFNVNRFFPSYVLSLEGPAGVSTTAVHKGLIGRLDLVATANSTTAGTIATTSAGDDQSGSAPNTPLSGTYSIDDTISGHGVFTIMGGASPHVSFYIIRPGVFYALRIDSNAASLNPDGILLGALHSIAVDTNGVPLNFDNTSLNGPFVFNLLGINAGNSSAATGHFSGTPGSSGTGTLAGFMDINDGGTVSSPSLSPIRPDTATFTISANGRGTWAIKLSGVIYNFVFYARGPGAGFLLEQPASDTSNRGRSGGWLVQFIGPPIAASGANGTYILATAVVTAASTNTLAVLSLNGGNANLGSFNGTSYSSKLGLAPATNPITGTFTVTDTTNGRGTLTVAAPGTISGNAQLAFEVYDSSDAVLVGIDNVNINTNPPIIVLDE